MPALLALLAVVGLPVVIVAQATPVSAAATSTLVQGGVSDPNYSITFAPAMSPSGSRLAVPAVVSGQQKVRLSSDGGYTWTTIDGVAGVKFSSVAISDTGAIYAVIRADCPGLYCPAVFYRYRNGAWSPSVPIPSSGASIEPVIVTNGPVLAVVSGSMFRSTDDGATWSQGESSGAGAYAIRVRVLGNYVHVVGDGGSTPWYRRWDITTGQLERVTTQPAFGTPEAVHYIFSAPNNPQRVFIAAGGSGSVATGGTAPASVVIHQSSDAGTTWTTLTDGPEMAPAYVRGSAPYSSPAGWAMGADARLYVIGNVEPVQGPAPMTTLRVASRGLDPSPDWSPVSELAPVNGASTISHGAWGIQGANGSVPSELLVFASVSQAGGGYNFYALHGTGAIVPEATTTSFTTNGALVLAECGCTEFTASPSRNWQAAWSTVAQSVVRSADGTHWEKVAVPPPPLLASGAVSKLAIGDDGDVYVLFGRSVLRFRAGRWWGPTSFGGFCCIGGAAASTLIKVGNRGLVSVDRDTGWANVSTDDGDTWSYIGFDNRAGPDYVTDRNYLDSLAAGGTGDGLSVLVRKDMSALSANAEYISSPNLPSASWRATLMVRADVAGELWIAAHAYNATAVALHRSLDGGSTWETRETGSSMPGGLLPDRVAFGLGGDNRLYAYGLKAAGTGQYAIVATNRDLAPGSAWSPLTTLDTLPWATTLELRIPYGSGNRMPTPPDLWVSGSAAGDRSARHYGQIGGLPPGASLSAGELFGGCNRLTSCATEVGAITNFGQPVDASTGNFWHTFASLSVPGRGASLRLTETYNSLAAGTNGPLGWGWTHSYMMSLSIGAGAGSVTVNQENAAQATFALVNGAYTAPPRVQGTLTRNGDGTWTLVRDKRETFKFDAGGKLVEIRDLNDYVTTLAYDAGKLKTVTDPAARKLTFTYRADNPQLIASVADDAARHVDFDYYTATWELKTITDVGGGITRFTYNGSHRLTTMLDRNQAASPTPVPVTNHYDAQGRVDWQKDFRGQPTSFDYTSIPGATEITDPRGNVTVQWYTNGFPTRVTRGYGTAAAATTSIFYDSTTLLPSTVVDPLEHATTYTYYADGRLKTRTDALDHATSFTYTAQGDVETVTDANGTTTTNHYDARANLEWTSTPLTSQPGVNRLTRYVHGDPGHPGDVTSMVDPNAKTWEYSYDAYGNLA
ncbi:MAG: DUF6531 domain-containing protein, partial [Acidimicrobiales bacterium]